LPGLGLGFDGEMLVQCEPGFRSGENPEPVPKHQEIGKLEDIHAGKSLPTGIRFSDGSEGEKKGGWKV
jgi:hypothetical protein